MDMEMVKNYIMPELLVLVPVLYILGCLLKHTEYLKDKYIPITLGITGVFLAFLYVIGNEGVSVIAVFTSLTQGLLTSGGAVYIDQLVKQGNKDE